MRAGRPREMLAPMERRTGQHRGDDAPADDEAAADAARRSLRLDGVVPIEPDMAVAVMLAAGERVLAARHGAHLEQLSPDDSRREPLIGDLYLTDQRLLVLGSSLLELSLDRIREAGVANGRLLLLMGDGDGVAIRVEDPRVLRVAIGAARTSMRAAGRRHSRDQSEPR